MIALVSSTILPRSRPDAYWGDGTIIPAVNRLEQTRATISSLVRFGFDQILLVDNSPTSLTENIISELAPAKVLLCEDTPSANKGISELLMLRRACAELPPKMPILKISGRYCLGRRLVDEIGDNELLVRFYHGRFRRNQYVSTMCYVARERTVFERFVNDVFREVYAFQSRIIGVRSLLRIFRNSMSPHNDNYPYHDPPTAIELAAAYVLRGGKYRYKEANDLGVSGISGISGQMHSN